MRGKVEAQFIDAGEQSLTNIASLLRVFRVTLTHPDPRVKPAGLWLTPRPGVPALAQCGREPAPDPIRAPAAGGG